MNCTVCGKEFGEGVCCQNCGVDRVTGLGNYSGFEVPSGQKETRGKRTSQSSYSTNELLSSNTMVCYACGEIIPSDSKFCPYCSTGLFVICPKCGHKYSSQFPVCSKCGTDREQYNKQLEAKRQKELAEKQEKERKQRAWEQMQRQREQEYDQQSKQSMMGCLNLFGYIFLFFGVLLIVVGLSQHGSENFRINPGKEISVYIFAAVLLIGGIALILNNKLK